MEQLVPGIALLSHSLILLRPRQGLNCFRNKVWETQGFCSTWLHTNFFSSLLLSFRMCWAFSKREQKVTISLVYSRSGAYSLQCLTWVFHGRTKPLWKLLFSQHRKEVRALLTVFTAVGRIVLEVCLSHKLFFFFKKLFYVGIWRIRRIVLLPPPNTHTQPTT